MPEISPEEFRPPWLLGLDGPEPQNDFLRLLERHPPAGILFFRDNLPRRAASIEPLKRKLEQAAGRPLSVFLDEEGGWIQVSGNRPAWPSPRALALAGTDTLERMHKALGRLSSSFGVTVVIAPLADLDDGAQNPVIGTRSFGPDPEESSRAVQASMNGLKAGGVLPVVKHFPGHGDSTEDSHITLPQVPEDRSEALRPFWRAIRLRVPGVMTAHLRLGDDPRPATYREDIVRGVLQDEMGYKGLVMTDALEMKGARTLPLEEQGVAALRAGHHLLTLARWRPEFAPMLDGVIEHGEELKAHIRLAWRRWDRFLAQQSRPAAEHLGADELEERLAAIRRGALFRPHGGEATGLGLDRIAIEFGPLGSWDQEDYMRELARFPMHKLDSDTRLKTGEGYLYIGRRAPSAARIEELHERATIGTTPPILMAGPWGWMGRRLNRQLATHDTSPPGVSELVRMARMADGTTP